MWASRSEPAEAARSSASEPFHPGQSPLAATHFGSPAWQVDVRFEPRRHRRPPHRSAAARPGPPARGCRSRAHTGARRQAKSRWPGTRPTSVARSTGQHVPPRRSVPGRCARGRAGRDLGFAAPGGRPVLSPRRPVPRRFAQPGQLDLIGKGRQPGTPRLRQVDRCAACRIALTSSDRSVLRCSSTSVPWRAAWAGRASRLAGEGN